MTMLTLILTLEIELIGIYILIVIVDKILERIDNHFNPQYPSCSVDPLCHSAFVRDKKERGWIHNYPIKENNVHNPLL